ncbi:hypothetical protein [Olivibacter sitiensis]|uniref:hypothetical protein n=1 Tax=Olivibacter sitiensis TaxID=376470 RepID=UPI000482A524|nr:hypothetical protein [Olivibacter sitiensis]
MPLENFKYVHEFGSPIMSLKFKGQIISKQWPKNNSGYFFYLKIYVTTEFGEHIILNCFRDKRSGIYSPRKGNLDFKEVQEGSFVDFELSPSAKGYFNIVTAILSHTTTI